MWLLAVALFGLLFGNGLFLYWLLFEFSGWSPVWANHLAVAFIIDAFVTLLVLAVWFAARPIGPYRWPWFVALSIAGGLCFGLPFYLWLNGETPGRRSHPIRVTTAQPGRSRMSANANPSRMTGGPTVTSTGCSNIGPSTTQV